MTDAIALASALTSELGADAVRTHASLACEGVELAVSVEPADADALARAVQVLTARERAAIVRGNGTRLALGNPPRRADVFLSTQRLAGLAEFDAEEGVLRAKSGTPLRALQLRLTSELPLCARIAVLPSRLSVACAALRSAGVELLVYPGLGLCYAAFAEKPSRGEETWETRLGHIEAAPRAGGGHFLLESAPLVVKQKHCVFSTLLSPDVLALMRAVKAQYDPLGTLNPGRCAGRI